MKYGIYKYFYNIKIWKTWNIREKNEKKENKRFADMIL